MAQVTITYAGPANGQTENTLTTSGDLPDELVGVFFNAWRDVFAKRPGGHTGMTDQEVWDTFAQQFIFAMNMFVNGQGGRIE